MLTRVDRKELEKVIVSRYKISITGAKLAAEFLIKELDNRFELSLLKWIKDGSIEDVTVKNLSMVGIMQSTHFNYIHALKILNFYLKRPEHVRRMMVPKRYDSVQYR